MEQQDYLKKQIDQLGKVLGELLSKIIGLSNSGQSNYGIKIANLALKKELDIDIDKLIEIPKEKFIETLQKNGELNNINLEKLADILFEIANGLLQNDKDSSIGKGLFERLLIIYEYIDKSGLTFSFERHSKVERINSTL